jgi:hypothetical protein
LPFPSHQHCFATVPAVEGLQLLFEKRQPPTPCPFNKDCSPLLSVQKVWWHLLKKPFEQGLLAGFPFCLVAMNLPFYQGVIGFSFFLLFAPFICQGV